MPTSHRPRRLQHSPLLALPPELRLKIYRHALVKSAPIDLWPHQWIVSIPETDVEGIIDTDSSTSSGEPLTIAIAASSSSTPSIASRSPLASELYTIPSASSDEQPQVPFPSITQSSSSQPRSRSTPTLPSDSPLKIRHQTDLEHVRKEMATGLLGTCSQIFNEAHHLFWSENQFRFPGRSGWQGLLRFFLSIGPAARQRITSIDVHAPIYMRWPVKDLDNKDLNGRSKNWPKLHMCQIPEEGHLDRVAIQRVCVLLKQDRSMKQMRFIVPAGFRNGDEDGYGGYEEDHDMDIDAELRLARIEELDFIHKTVVIERDGYLAVENGPEQITSRGWDLTCEPGSYIWECRDIGDKNDTPEYDKYENEQRRQWQSAYRQWDYLDGIQALMEEHEEMATHANGGRHKCALRSHKRHLTAFGGCRFIEDGRIILPWGPALQNLTRASHVKCQRTA